MGGGEDQKVKSTVLDGCWPLSRNAKIKPTNTQQPEHRVWEEGWMRKTRYGVKSENTLFNTVITGEMTKGDCAWRRRDGYVPI